MPSVNKKVKKNVPAWHGEIMTAKSSAKFSLRLQPRYSPLMRVSISLILEM